MRLERNDKIGIIELGRVGVVALRALLALGWRDFVLGDARTVSLTDVLGDSTYRRSDLGQRRVDAATRVLVAEFPDSRFELCAGPEDGPRWSVDWLERCAVCVLACDAANELVAFEVNATCLATRIPLVPGL